MSLLERAKQSVLRERNRKENISFVFDIKKYLTKPQVKFVLDKSKQKAALVPRRGGKTISGIYYMLSICLKKSYQSCIYLGPTLKQSKQIIWDDLSKIVNSLGITAKFNKPEGSIYFQNGSKILRLSPQ